MVRIFVEIYMDKKKAVKNFINALNKMIVFKGRGSKSKPQIKAVKKLKEAVNVGEPVQRVVQPKNISENYCSENGFLAKLKESLKPARIAWSRKRKERIAKILDHFGLHDKITNDKVQSLLGVSHATAARYLKQLVKENKFVRFGFKKNTFYRKAG